MTTTWNGELNRRIEEIRLARKIPRTAVARAAGIKADTYRVRILEGRAFNLDEISAVCALIGVDMLKLFSEIDHDMSKTYAIELGATA